MLLFTYCREIFFLSLSDQSAKVHQRQPSKKQQRFQWYCCLLKGFFHNLTRYVCYRYNQLPTPNIVFIFVEKFKLVSIVQLFWEGHKNLRNLPRAFDINLVNVKTMRKIAQIFVTFSKKLNYNDSTKKILQKWWPVIVIKVF